MNNSEFIKLFEAIVEADPGTLKESDILDAIDGWDSLAVVALIAMVDEKAGIPLPPNKISSSVTIHDLILLVNGKNM